MHETMVSAQAPVDAPTSSAVHGLKFWRHLTLEQQVVACSWRWSRSKDVDARRDLREQEREILRLGCTIWETADRMRQSDRDPNSLLYLTHPWTLAHFAYDHRIATWQS